jgi:hypothetical protein
VSGSATFAFEVVACAVLGLVLWVACAGVGGALLPARAPAPDRDDRAAPASWNHPGVAACVGLGVLIALGGVAVLLRVPWWLVTGGFVVAGLVVAGRALRRRAPHLADGSLPLIAIALMVLLGVAALEAIVGFRFKLHPWDDMRAYLPLAHRLIDTNGLEDAWNVRRVQNLGGFTFLQAMPVAVFGHRGLAIVETSLASIFLGGLFVFNGTRTLWARWVSIAAIAVIPLLWVPRINTTGVLFGVPLLVAVFGMTVELRSSLREARGPAAVRWALAAGVVVAALMCVRPNLALVAGGLVVVGSLVLRGGALRSRGVAVVVAGGAAVICLGAWSIAAWRTVDTPFFLLDAGNQVPQAFFRPAPDGFLDVMEGTWHLVQTGPYFWAALLGIVLAIAARRQLVDAPLAVMAALVTIAVAVAIALVESTASRIAFVRYTAPASQALAVFVFVEFLRTADAGPRADAVRAASPTQRGLALGAVALIAAFSFSGIGLSLEYDTEPGGARLLADALGNNLRPLPAQVVTSPNHEAAYRRALARVDPERTITAVDRPYLIDYGRYDLPNMDLPGFAAPDAAFPFFRGPVAKIERLRRAGFDTLLATDPGRDAALNPVYLRTIRGLRIPAYSPTTRYYLDWEEDLAQIAGRAPDAVQRYGPLLVIDLPRAARELNGQR